MLFRYFHRRVSGFFRQLAEALEVVPIFLLRYVAGFSIFVLIVLFLTVTIRWGYR